jgi:hypothetical protein
MWSIFFREGPFELFRFRRDGSGVDRLVPKGIQYAMNNPEKR